MNKVKYLHDDKFLSIPDYNGDSIVVPVSLLDEINERSLRPSQIEELLFFRSITRDAQQATWTTMKELTGVNLEGKECFIYFANWEDSEWMSTSAARSVICTGNGDYENYRFLFNEKQEAWQYGGDEEEEDDEKDDADRFWPEALLGNHFSGYSSVLVVTR